LVCTLKPWNSQYLHTKGLISSPWGSCHLEGSGRILIRNKWSAIEFSTPFLSLISKSNSWSRRIHLMSLGLVSFLVRRYFRAAWSV
jgi:hypothetical protein